ncbi:MAG TPA: hypothetical protein VFA78_01335 [Chloroflexota bacterium]|nr:hypothetical protein [Chloroflexota bacterium]
MNEFDPLAILGRLVEGDVDFVIIGGLAATIHGAAIPTRDLDVMYDREPANLERLAAVLAGLSVRLRGAEDVPLRVDARLLRNGDRFTFTTPFGDIDILATADGAASYGDVRERAQLLDIGPYRVRVASLDDLIDMKRGANRPKDEPKLAELLELRDLTDS